MQAQPHPRQEERLAALRSYGILDTPRERGFDEVVELIAEICETPIAVVNLIDEHRQWFKAEVGLGVRETPLATSICAHVILMPGLTVVPDLLGDQRFCENPLCVNEPNLRFYAGMCLQTDDGLPLGTLCVLDTRPRELSELQKSAIMVMGRQVMRQIQLTTALKQSDLLRQEVDHRVKNSLSIVKSLLALQGRQSKNADVKAELGAASNRISAIAEVHDQLQRYSLSNTVEVRRFLEGLGSAVAATVGAGANITIAAPQAYIAAADAISVGLMVNELVTNAIRHGSATGETSSIQIEATENAGRLDVAVADQGRGLPESFEIKSQSGLGMKLCLSLAQSLGGELTATSASSGTSFRFSVPLASA